MVPPVEIRAILRLPLMGRCVSLPAMRTVLMVMAVLAVAGCRSEEPRFDPEEPSAEPPPSPAQPEPARPVVPPAPTPVVPPPAPPSQPAGQANPALLNPALANETAPATFAV